MALAGEGQNERSEFGVPRTNCSCGVCKLNCQHMPGFLIPSDLDRLIPIGTDPYRWAEENLLASPGALAVKDGEMFRIRTLVPAVQPNGACINLTEDGQCKIHDAAPFGCAFFDCGPETPGLVERGMAAICEAMEDTENGVSLYVQLWIHLAYKGLSQKPPEELRAKMRKSIIVPDMVADAQAEVERLKGLGWTKDDFANGLKEMLEGED